LQLKLSDAEQSGGPFKPRHRTTVLHRYTDCEIEAIDVERNIQITRMMRVRCLVKAPYLTASQNNLTDSLGVALPALEQVAQVKSTQLILVVAR
jgi:hypothetical protein